MEDGCQLLEQKGGRACGCATCDASPWIDDATLVVDISVVIFNPTYGVYTRASSYFFFARGGRIWKRVALNSVPAQADGSYSIFTWVTAVFWVICMIYVAESA